MMENNNDLSSINFIYKPYRYTLKNSIIHLSCHDQDIVLKKKSPKVLETHKYLSTCGFNNFVPIIDENRDNYYVYPYIKENSVPYEQKGKDLSKVLALMHAKTSYQKSVNKADIEKIYNDISDNLSYAKDFYSDLYDKTFLTIDYNPFQVIYMDYYSKLSNMIDFSQNEIDEWYISMEDIEKVRVSLVHNNLDLSHFVKGDNDYLISFDNCKRDTPVLDLAAFYKKEYNKIDFDEWFKIYKYYSELSTEELKLFFALITIPDVINLSDDIFKNIDNLNNLITYMDKTEELIRPYYAKDEKEE